MERLYLCAIGLAAVAQATPDQMQDDLTALFQNSSSMRVFAGTIANSIESLDGYGCWCYFYNRHGKGKSKPVDDVDAFCKILHQGYACAILEGEAADETCVPWEEPYTSAVDLIIPTSDLFQVCADRNPGNLCAQRACAVEGSFVESVFSTFASGIVINHADYSHASGFDTAEGCPVQKGPGAGSEKACCGSYPVRYPYRTMDGLRGCCNERTYRTDRLACCDGALKTQCSA